MRMTDLKVGDYVGFGAIDRREPYAKGVIRKIYTHGGRWIAIVEQFKRGTELIDLELKHLYIDGLMKIHKGTLRLLG